MKSFITEDFLLQTDFARTLYHQYARDLPIIDYHCHLSPREIAGNYQFKNLTEIWLKGDHYKWRAMRTLGLDERYITGDAADQEKFERWAFTVPYTVRNPLYHWTHLELSRYFDEHSLLNAESGERIYGQVTEKLQSDEYRTVNLLRKMHVEVICTTDDPIDSLDAHRKISQSSTNITILPTFRPDKAYAIEDGQTYNAYCKKLSEAAGIEIKSFTNLLDALKNRADYFHSLGCRLSDHGLEYIPYPKGGSDHSPDLIFKKVIGLKPVTDDEIRFFKYSVLIWLGKLYHAKGWTQQFHLGALRNTNSRMMNVLGPDTGFDSIGDFPQSVSIARFLNELDSVNQLSQTILYNLNPSDNEVLGTMIGNFNDGSAKGKIQFGSAWWFLDQKDGMEKQINSLSNLGLLSCFIGMLTDSRSFMSYPRHEYFRRILCNMLGNDVKNGELPNDEKWLGKIVADICYHNAKAYFKF